MLGLRTGAAIRTAIVIVTASCAAAPIAAYAQGENLALNKSTRHSSDCSCGRSTAAVDGNTATFRPRRSLEVGALHDQVRDGKFVTAP